MHMAGLGSVHCSALIPMSLLWLPLTLSPDKLFINILTMRYGSDLLPGSVGPCGTSSCCKTSTVWHFLEPYGRVLSYFRHCMFKLTLQWPKPVWQFQPRLLYSGKYLNEECWIEHYQQLSFKYFVKQFLITKLLSKKVWIQTTISHGLLKALMG